MEAFKLWSLQKGREAADMLPQLQQISWESFRLLSLQRRSQAVALCVVDLQDSLRTVGYVFLCAAELQGGCQTIGSVVLQAAEPMGGL